MKQEQGLMRMFPFFRELSINNNREWFAVHKQEYMSIREEWIAGIQRFIAALANEWPAVRYCDAAQCTHRIYRDTRFSPDKTPYKTYISTSVSPLGKGCDRAGVYVQAGLNQDEMGIYGGIWHPEAESLKKLRRAIETNSEEWLEIVNSPELVKIYGTRWCGEALKTAPKGYAKDHELIEYLRLKDIGKECLIPAQLFGSDNWPEELAEKAVPLVPLVEFLNYSLTEE